MKTVLTIATACALAGCGGKTSGVAVETQFKPTYITTRAPCPDRESYLALKAGRPTPLRDQPMPDSPDVRTAQTAAQLGKYEAKGGWADKVEKTLDRCQQ